MPEMDFPETGGGRVGGVLKLPALGPFLLLSLPFIYLENQAFHLNKY